ncbi:hypothetical protein AVEN_133999-1 [Araneus ventricosus]|uniref:Uncharacterized protein n=1 Tax=Araneus ventricosus TaxID=182803 RepID=A0A4Y2SPU6_ARAVE|nr:hypothetical protein AVEN_133999-1 [Araneus ventricosus]
MLRAEQIRQLHVKNLKCEIVMWSGRPDIHPVKISIPPFAHPDYKFSRGRLGMREYTSNLVKAGVRQQPSLDARKETLTVPDCSKGCNS